MKEYDVKITETLEKTVTVEAKSRADAEDQVRSAYYNSEYILDSENFTGVQFGITEEREIQQEQAETILDWMGLRQQANASKRSRMPKLSAKIVLLLLSQSQSAKRKVKSRLHFMI